MTTRTSSTAVAFCASVLLFGSAYAQSSEMLSFSTFTPTGHTNLLLGTSARAEIRAEASLSLPSSATQKAPAVVILPGAGGHVDTHLNFWRSKLLSSGVAVAAVDPLRIRDMGPEQSERLSLAADLADAFNLLKVLVSHPQIDGNRVGVLGFSRGGLSAWDSQARAFASAVLGPSGINIRFAAHAALYPPCHYVHVEQQKVGSPMLIVLAGADARTPPEHCQSLVKVARERGYDPQVTVIEGAQHAFDYFLPVFRDTNAFSSKGCRAVAVDTAPPYPRPVHLDDGSPLIAGDGAAPVARILEWSRQCRRATSALTGNQSAEERERAVAVVLNFFIATLKP